MFGSLVLERKENEDLFFFKIKEVRKHFLKQVKYNWDVIWLFIMFFF